MSIVIFKTAHDQSVRAEAICRRKVRDQEEELDEQRQQQSSMAEMDPKSS